MLQEPHVSSVSRDVAQSGLNQHHTRTSVATTHMCTMEWPACTLTAQSLLEDADKHVDDHVQ